MAFVDEVTIHALAGPGGNGAVAFHREPYKPRGGPDGGNGGDGASVILRADESVGTLLELRDHPHIKALKGAHGEGKRKHGANSEDKIVLVPPGTMVYDETGVLLADLAGPGDELVGARGGRGGRGNAHFTTSTRRTPGFSEKGEPGEERKLRLELRLLADVGLVGFPNAGKSTLIARISAAKPKIADYPFTTLVPNLGVVRHGEDSFVVADIPGLVAGASEGKGLGHRFLRHVSRAAVLVFLTDLTAIDRDPRDDFEVLKSELEAFDPELAARPTLQLATKVDAAPDADIPEGALGISAVSGEGIDTLLRVLAEMVKQSRVSTPRQKGYVRHVMRDDPTTVAREDKAWRVTGKQVERLVATTDMDNEEALTRLQRRLITMGVERELAAAGARAGDEVRIGDAAFDFEPEHHQ
ncbi:MAG: GTPase [Actinomycetota bacterium]|jgi:GTP-binding protein|nr:GTPase [Actinomycetota bacterium]